MSLHCSHKEKLCVERCVLAYVQIASAMARMHERKNIGKIILCPRKSSDPAAEVEPVP